MDRTIRIVDLLRVFTLASGVYWNASANAVDTPQYASIDTCRFIQSGEASWYGPGLIGSRMANGQRFDPGRLTVAHRNIALGDSVIIMNIQTGASVTAVVTDRGPYAHVTRNRRGQRTVQTPMRIVDLSREVARRIGLEQAGIGEVSIYHCPRWRAPRVTS